MPGNPVGAGANPSSPGNPAGARPYPGGVAVDQATLVTPGFTIPDDVIGGTPEQHSQAGLDSVHLAVMRAALRGFGVLDGTPMACQVVADGQDMQLLVQPGQVVIGGQLVGVAGQFVTAVADPTNPSWTLVFATVSGNVIAVQGTPATAWSASTPGPVFPSLPPNVVALAAVYVGGGATAVAASDITDLRCFVPTTVIPAPSGSSVQAWVTKAANYTLLTGDGGAIVTASGVSITLPAAPTSWVRYGVKSGGNFTVTVVGTIDGQTNYQVPMNAAQYFMWDGAAWRLV